MEQEEGGRKCRKADCETIIPHRYPWDVCTPCTMADHRTWRTAFDLERLERQKAVWAAQSDRLRKIAADKRAALEETRLARQEETV